MIKISRKVDYGLLLLSALAVNKGKRVRLRRIAKEYKLPYRFLSRIASKLAAGGLVKSKAGVKGGYQLAGEAEAISLFEVVKELEGEPALVNCLKEDRDCQCEVGCVHKRGIKRLRDELIVLMKKTSIADMIESGGKVGWRRK